jgi:hypothetical protein
MEDSTLRIGAALHSLRAVPQDAMQAVLDSGLVDAAPTALNNQQASATPSNDCDCVCASSLSRSARARGRRAQRSARTRAGNCRGAVSRLE